MVTYGTQEEVAEVEDVYWKISEKIFVWLRRLRVDGLRIVDKYRIFYSLWYLLCSKSD